MKYLAVIPVLLAILCVPGDAPAETGRDSAMVVYGGDTLFMLHYGIDAFSAGERAAAISRQLEKVAERSPVDPESVTVEHREGLSIIEGNGNRLMTVTDDDGLATSMTREALAEEYARRIREAVGEPQESGDMTDSLLRVLWVVLYLGAGVVALLALRWLFPRLYVMVERWERKVIRSVRIREITILKAETVVAGLILALKGVRLTVSLAVLYLVMTELFSLIPWTREWDLKPVLRGLFLVILVSVSGIVILKGLNALHGALQRGIAKGKGTAIRAVRLKTVEIISADRIAAFMSVSVRVLHGIAVVFLLYFFLTLVFSFFEFTRTWSSTLLQYIMNPLAEVVSAVVNYLPNVFFILVIIIVTRYALKLIKVFFGEVSRGTIQLGGFHPEWGEPTYKIVRFLVIAFAAMVIFPYLPGSDSGAFRGISIFLGILFSLGSAGAIGNVVAGVILTYMRPFRIGDRVRIAETVGDVVEKTLLVTRVRTIKNVDVTIPNALVLSSHIINFSTVAQERGLILHTTVTIGYDVPWKQVHDLLIRAARETQGILSDPPPFVLQTSLDDSYVRYELNAYTRDPNKMATTSSFLHQSIQDKFHEAGIEIMSPQYSAVRDGNKTAIPDEHLPKGYTAPGFRIFPTGLSPFKHDDRQ